MVLRYLTAGESHGAALVGIIEGLPAGLFLDPSFINQMLARRQGGYGRGGRMSIEHDSVRIISGLRFGKTLGSPVSMIIENKDWENWQDVMAVEAPAPLDYEMVTRPRPGHGDLSGGLKYLHRDLRNVLERASARETAMRTAAGAVASLLLRSFNIEIAAFVYSVGGIETSFTDPRWKPETIRELIATSPLYCPDKRVTQLMMEKIEQAREQGDTLGGVFEIRAFGLPPGLGSHVHADRRLDGRLAAALMSIPGIKGVEIGLGFEGAKRPGSVVHDAIYLDEKGKKIYRKTNRAGGLEGGMTSGEPLVLRAAMKPIPTLTRALFSVNLSTLTPEKAAVERSDICAVPAASVVGEAVVAWELARALMEKFAGDSMEELNFSYRNFLELVEKYLTP